MHVNLINLSSIEASTIPGIVSETIFHTDNNPRQWNEYGLFGVPKPEKIKKSYHKFVKTTPKPRATKNSSGEFPPAAPPLPPPFPAADVVAEGVADIVLDIICCVYRIGKGNLNRGCGLNVLFEAEIQFQMMGYRKTFFVFKSDPSISQTI